MNQSISLKIIIKKNQSINQYINQSDALEYFGSKLSVSNFNKPINQLINQSISLTILQVKSINQSAVIPEYFEINPLMKEEEVLQRIKYSLHTYTYSAAHIHVFKPKK